MLGHVDIGGEVTGDDGVEEDEDAEREPEEEADDGEEEGLGPGRVHVGGTARVGGVVLVVGDGEDGGGQEDGEQPGDQADQTSLVLGPDQPRPQRETHRVVPKNISYFFISWKFILLSLLSETPLFTTIFFGAPCKVYNIQFTASD